MDNKIFSCPMNSTDAINLQLRWGGKPCDHPDAISVRSEEEIPTDIWHCTQCGHVIDIDAWMKAREVDEQ